MKVRPRLVKNKETGELCLQIVAGSHNATLAIPPHIQAEGGERLENFITMATEEMMRGLDELNHQEKIRNRWKKGYYG